MVDLAKKYDRSGPRYTSYPPLPFWKGLPDKNRWQQLLSEKLKQYPTVDLYLHFPFCRQICAYCGCHRFLAKDSTDKDFYLEHLLKEWELYQTTFGPLKIGTIHLGGGTPTFYSPEQLDHFLSRLPLQDLSVGAVEIDPRSLQEQHLDVFKKHRINRLSLGIQDFDSDVQSAIKRIQSFDLVKLWVEKIRARNFETLNFDLIYGLAKQNVESIKRTLDMAMRLGPDSFAIYSYAHLPAKLENQRSFENAWLPSAAEKLEMAQVIRDYWREHGYVDIGFDHYARSDHFLSKSLEQKKLKRTFMGYTDEKNEVLLGLGVSSIGQCSGLYFQNVKPIDQYGQMLERGEFPIGNGHELSEQDKYFAELIFEILCQGQWPKTVPGIAPSVFAELKVMAEDGLLKESAKGFEVTDLGRPFLRNVAMLYDPYLSNRPETPSFSRSL